MAEQEYSVVIYTLPSCVQCNAEKKWFSRRGIEFESFDVSSEEGEKGRRKIKNWLYSAAPVTVIRNAKSRRLIEHFGGWQISKAEKYFPKDKYPVVKSN